MSGLPSEGRTREQAGRNRYHGPMIRLVLAAWLVAACSVPAALAGDEAFNGRWVIQPLGGNGNRALWLEVNGAGTDTIHGGMVGGGPGGQLDTIHEARVENGQLRFHLERRTGRNRDRIVRTEVAAALHGDRLHGVAIRERGPLLWVGQRAPVLSEKDDGSWKESDPVPLYDGKGIDGWHTVRPGREGDWYSDNGILKNRKGADVLVSDDEFWNFRLEAEFLIHPGMNGGIGLRGRYEIQLLDDHGRPPSDHGNAALYGRIAPSVNASKPAGEWQTLDVRLVGREVTVVLNGVKTINRAEVEGFTAMATDWREGLPGPITLQGDHGAVEFRRIQVTPLKQ